MENLLPIIIQLASGAIGGNLAGSLLKKYDMGTLWNSIAGIVGGGIGGQLLGLLGLASGSGEMDLNGILSSVAGGGVGGGLLMTIIGLIRSSMNKE